MTGDKNAIQKLNSHEAVTHLRQLCEEVDALKKARTKIEEDATCKTRFDDLPQKFLTGLQASMSLPWVTK